LRKEKRKKSKSQTRNVCGLCKPHKRKPKNDTKKRREIKKQIEEEATQ
jgi:hypothetical protein